VTTVVYHNGVLAADSRSCGGDWVSANDVRKVWRSRDGRLVGITGDLALAETYARWLLGSGETSNRPALGGNGRCIEVLSRNLIKVHEFSGAFFTLRGASFAWGSGSPAARAALLMGADAIAAVRIAMQIDPATGGRIRSVRLT